MTNKDASFVCLNNEIESLKNKLIEMQSKQEKMDNENINLLQNIDKLNNQILCNKNDNDEKLLNLNNIIDNLKNDNNELENKIIQLKKEQNDLLLKTNTNSKNEIDSLLEKANEKFIKMELQYKNEIKSNDVNFQNKLKFQMNEKDNEILKINEINNIEKLKMKDENNILLKTEKDKNLKKEKENDERQKLYCDEISKLKSQIKSLQNEKETFLINDRENINKLSNYKIKCDENDIKINDYLLKINKLEKQNKEKVSKEIEQELLEKIIKLEKQHLIKISEIEIKNENVLKLELRKYNQEIEKLKLQFEKGKKIHIYIPSSLSLYSIFFSFCPLSLINILLFYKM